MYILKWDLWHFYPRVDIYCHYGKSWHNVDNFHFKYKEKENEMYIRCYKLPLQYHLNHFRKKFEMEINGL